LVSEGIEPLNQTLRLQVNH